MVDETLFTEVPLSPTMHSLQLIIVLTTLPQVSPELLELFEALLPLLDKSGRRKVQHDKFLDLMEQV